MIKQISIENFRCFGKTDIKDFQRVNLIGGLNNSGKTVLLEAILLICNPYPHTILFLKDLRNEDVQLEKDFFEYVWDNFFLNRDRLHSIIISCLTYPSVQNKDSSNAQSLVIQASKEFITIKNKSRNEEQLHDTLSIKTYLDKLPSPYESELDFEIYINNEKILNRLNNDDSFSISKKLPDAIFIGVNNRKKPHVLAKEYSFLEKIGQEDIILRALQSIDKSITAINVSVIGGIHLGIKKSGKGFMPLSLFGDALNRIVQIILSIANNRGSIILIDEVENGIHHTAQREFWTYLFKIAKEFDVQVFATTHSLEMINAFSEVAGKDFVEDAAYFELVRHLKTGEIVGIKHKIDTLEYEIIKKMKFRGEPTA